MRDVYLFASRSRHLSDLGFPLVRVWYKPVALLFGTCAGKREYDSDERRCIPVVLCRNLAGERLDVVDVVLGTHGRIWLY